MSSHIPNRGEQMVRYYGYYSNVSRGKRQKEGRDDLIPCILEPLGDEKMFRRNWARLIKKIYEVDPLVCPKCQRVMRIVSSIEDPTVIRDILKHLGLGLSGPDRPRKSMTRLSAYAKQPGWLPHTSWMTSAVNYPSMTITSIRILNTPVTNTSWHNAL